MDRIKEIAKRIDHTILKADASSEQVRKVCDECRKYGFGMIAINGAQVELCRRELEGTDTHVGAAIGFPLGQMDLVVKAFETRIALVQMACVNPARLLGMETEMGSLRPGLRAEMALFDKEWNCQGTIVEGKWAFGGER